MILGPRKLKSSTNAYKNVSPISVKDNTNPNSQCLANNEVRKEMKPKKNEIGNKREFKDSYCIHKEFRLGGIKVHNMPSLSKKTLSISPSRQ